MDNSNPIHGFSQAAFVWAIWANTHGWLGVCETKPRSKTIRGVQMHCPTCGTQTSGTQRFCRSCGLELQTIQQIVASQLSGSKPAQHQVERRARLAWLLFSGIAVMFGGGGLLALEKRYELGDPAGLLGLLMVFSGMLLSMYAVLSPILHPRTAPHHTPEPAALSVANTTSKLALNAGLEPVLSVTEHTTRTLEPTMGKSSGLSRSSTAQKEIR